MVNPLKPLLEQANKAMLDGCFDLARSYYQAVLREDEKCGTAMINLSIIYGITGDYENAAHYSIMATEIEEYSRIAYNNLGLIYYNLNKDDLARSCFLKALEKDANYPDALNGLGNVESRCKNYHHAEECYRKAISIEPSFADACNNLGELYLEQGRHEEAFACLRDCLVLTPQKPEVHYNIARLFSIVGNRRLAIRHHGIALGLKWDYIDVYLELASLHHSVDDTKTAVFLLEKIIKRYPGEKRLHNNLGVYYHCLDRINHATDEFCQALLLDPEYSTARKNLGMLQLLRGDLDSGFKNYEYRRHEAGFAQSLVAIPSEKLIKWLGQKTSVHKPLYVVCEQGIGDTIHFIRYVSLLHYMGYHVKICVEYKLQTLIGLAFPDCEVVGCTELRSASRGFWIPLLSLPYCFLENSNFSYLSSPYIIADVERVKTCNQRMSNKNRLTIGLHWKGNPMQEMTVSKGRSFALHDLEPLLRLEGISFVSLQKGSGSEELASSEYKDKFVDCQEEIDKTLDFVETASIIENCDLVISNDTMIAHLAGSLGKPVWILLKNVPEWRWGQVFDRSPWYSSARLIRTPEGGSWSDVIKRVAELLLSILSEKDPPSLLTLERKSEVILGYKKDCKIKTNTLDTLFEEIPFGSKGRAAIDALLRSFRQNTSIDTYSFLNCHVRDALFMLEILNRETESHNEIDDKPLAHAASGGNWVRDKSKLQRVVLKNRTLDLMRQYGKTYSATE